MHCRRNLSWLRSRGNRQARRARFARCCCRLRGRGFAATGGDHPPLSCSAVALCHFLDCAAPTAPGRLNSPWLRPHGGGICSLIERRLSAIHIARVLSAARAARAGAQMAATIAAESPGRKHFSRVKPRASSSHAPPRQTAGGGANRCSATSAPALGSRRSNELAERTDSCATGGSAVRSVAFLHRLLALAADGATTGRQLEISSAAPAGGGCRATDNQRAFNFRRGAVPGRHRARARAVLAVSTASSVSA